jgi:hypothetical protein
MKPTRIGTLVALIVCVAAMSWGVLNVRTDHGGTLPPLTWAAPAGVVLLAVVVLVTALGLRARLQQPSRRPHPLSMARMAVLGKASAHVGPLVGGLYAGYLLVLLPDLDIGARRDRAVLCVVALVASVVLSVAGLLLERSCRVPPSGSDDEVPAARA